MGGEDAHGVMTERGHAGMRQGEFIVPDGNGGITRVPPYEEILEEARRRFEAYESTIGQLRGKVAELEDEAYADKRMAEMQAEVERSRKALARGFAIGDEAWDSIRSWQRRHVDEEHGGELRGGAIGGTWTYSFIPTSIGVVGTVRCVCGAEHTFQDLD